MATKTVRKTAYDDQSIKSLKGAERVRKRPAVIFGSDDLIGCQHSFIEILANSVDEAREGYGSKIIVKKFLDLSIEVEDFGAPPHSPPAPVPTEAHPPEGRTQSAIRRPMPEKPARTAYPAAGIGRPPPDIPPPPAMSAATPPNGIE